MQTFRNQSFEGRSFLLDEVAFIGCKLKNCDLYYAGGDVEMLDTGLESCHFHWRGPARNTMALLQSLGMLRVPNQRQTPFQVNIAGHKAN